MGAAEPDGKPVPPNMTENHRFLELWHYPQPSDTAQILPKTMCRQWLTATGSAVALYLALPINASICRHSPKSPLGTTNWNGDLFQNRRRPMSDLAAYCAASDQTAIVATSIRIVSA